MFVHCACIWKICARFEGCLFTVCVYRRLVQGLRDVCSLWHVYGRLVQGLRDVCSLCMYMEDLCKVSGMFVHCACIWKTCARFEGCLFTVHVYGRLVQGLRDVCSLWMYMEDLCKV